MVYRPLACVTGASSGIGEQFARQLAAKGYDLILVARNVERLDALARELEKYHDAACDVIAADLSTGPARERVTRRLLEGDVETMVNAAGFGSYGELVGRPPSEIESMLELNILSLTMLSRAAVESMVRRRHGALCNVSSIAAFVPGAGAATYHASKAFVLSFTEALHEEVRHFGVHVTALCPGFTPTSFHDRAGIRADGVPALVTTDAGMVVRRGLAALARNDAVCLPGRIDRLLVAMSRLAPAAVIRRSTARVVGHIAGEPATLPPAAAGAGVGAGRGAQD